MSFDQRELRYFVGFDLGQSQDYSAISILQQDYDAFQRQYLYQLRYLERVPLGTKYSSSDPNEDSVTRRVKRILLSDTLNGNTEKGIDPPIEPVALVLDHTGVGSPISELFELPRLLTGPGPQYKLVKINITGGLNPSRSRGGYNVPKRDIVFSLLRVFQSGRLKISGKLALARTFQDELLNFKVKISDDGKDTYGAWREGVHDDLVLSVAMVLGTLKKDMEGGQYRDLYILFKGNQATGPDYCQHLRTEPALERKRRGWQGHTHEQIRLPDLLQGYP